MRTSIIQIQLSKVYEWRTCRFGVRCATQTTASSADWSTKAWAAASIRMTSAVVQPTIATLATLRRVSMYSTLKPVPWRQASNSFQNSSVNMCICALIWDAAGWAGAAVLLLQRDHNQTPRLLAHEMHPVSARLHVNGSRPVNSTKLFN